MENRRGLDNIPHFCLQYERTQPIYKGLVNQTGPIYTVVGNGGTPEGLYTEWLEPAPAWSVYRSLSLHFATHTLSLCLSFLKGSTPFNCSQGVRLGICSDGYRERYAFALADDPRQ